MIDPEELFSLFEDHLSDLSEASQEDKQWADFDRGRALGSVIMRKVADLVDTYKRFDHLSDPDNVKAAKDRTLKIYNKALLALIRRIDSSNPHIMRGIAIEDTHPVSNIIDTLTKHFERTEDFKACTDLVFFKEELLYHDLTRNLWVTDYEGLV